jgi:hypothetical protein
MSEDRSKANQLTKDELRWYRQQLGAAALGLLAGLIIVVPAVLWLSGFLLPKKQHEQPEIARRIGVLTDILNKSARAIGDIETEITQRRELVRQLEKDAQRAKQLSAVSREQAEAVAQTLKIELERREQSSFWSSQLLSLFYVLLGVVAAEIFRYVRGRYLRRASQRGSDVASRET